MHNDTNSSTSVTPTGNSASVPAPNQKERRLAALERNADSRRMAEERKNEARRDALAMKALEEARAMELDRDLRARMVMDLAKRGGLLTEAPQRVSLPTPSAAQQEQPAANDKQWWKPSNLVDEFMITRHLFDKVVAKAEAQLEHGVHYKTYAQPLPGGGVNPRCRLYSEAGLDVLRPGLEQARDKKNPPAANIVTF